MTEAPTNTGVRARTRRAILDAAVAALSADPGATLADIATAAGVGRTTVHRYFPERAALLEALAATAWDRVVEATERARPTEGPAAQALARLCQEYFDLGEVLTLVFNDPQLNLSGEWDKRGECGPTDSALTTMVERGHQDGTIDPRMPARWVQNVLWSLLYAAWQHAQTPGVPRHEALELCLHALRKAVTPPPGRAG